MSRGTYRALKIAAEVTVPVVIVLAWQVWATHAHSQWFPPPWDILKTSKDMWLFSSSVHDCLLDGYCPSQFDDHVVPSLERIGAGYGLAVLAGIALGIPLGLSRWGRTWAMPHIEYWRAIPPPALLPISIVLLHDIGNKQKVAFIGFFCLFPVLLNTIDGVRGIDPTLIETARSYGVPSLERIRRIVLPAAAPQIAAGMRNSLSLAVITMVLSEYFSSTSGVGYVLLISKNTYQSLPMWAAILLIGLLGYLLNVLFVLFERRLLAWHRGWRAAAPA